MLRLGGARWSLRGGAVQIPEVVNDAGHVAYSTKAPSPLIPELPTGCPRGRPATRRLVAIRPPSVIRAIVPRSDPGTGSHITARSPKTPPLVEIAEPLASVPVVGGASETLNGG